MALRGRIKKNLCKPPPKHSENSVALQLARLRHSGKVLAQSMYELYERFLAVQK